MRQSLPLRQVRPNPDQPRKVFEPKALRELANSIRERGLMQAITVRPVEDGWMIVGGERRWRAHQLLAQDGALGAEPTILCEVVEMNDDEMALQAIVENLQRQDISPLEEARAYQNMLDRGWSVEQLAKDLGISQSWRIRDRTKLLNLDETIQTLVNAKQFPVGHAWEIADLPKHDQIAIVQQFNAGKLTNWAAMKAAAQAVRDRNAQGSMFDPQPEPTKQDKADVDRAMRTVERILAAIASGWSDGECVALKTVDPNKAEKMADKLAASSRTLRAMEAQLRAAHARSMML